VKGVKKVEDKTVTFQIGSLPTLTFITFLILKLCNVIDWSWWWVTAPLWIPIGLVIGIYAIILIAVVIIAIATNTPVRFKRDRSIRRYR
jgi:phosphoglycerol transferase MdoB-like AlkP superfamily enzyme